MSDLRQAGQWAMDKEHSMDCKKRRYPKAADTEPCTCGRDDAIAIIQSALQAEMRCETCGGSGFQHQRFMGGEWTDGS